MTSRASPPGKFPSSIFLQGREASSDGRRSVYFSGCLTQENSATGFSPAISVSTFPLIR